MMVFFGDSVRVFLILLLVSSSKLLAVDIAGSVSAAGSPLSDVRITVFSDDLSFFMETRSAADGSWQLINIPDGSYNLGWALRGYEYLEEQVTLSNLTTPFVRLLETETQQGSWEVIGTTAPEFLDASDIASLLPDGRIFFCHNTLDSIVFDPVTGSSEFPPPSGSEQGCMNGTLLQDGSLLFVGGQDGADPGSFTDAVRWVKTWSLTSGWQQLPDLVHPVGRWYAGLTRFADGSVIAMGGGTAPSAERTDTTEIFNLISQTWQYSGPMLEPCEFPPTALLFDGRVLATWSVPQIYSRQTGLWTATGNFQQANRGFPGHADHSLVVTSDGRVLAFGTRSTDLAEPRILEIFDPNTETWSLGAQSGLLRSRPEIVQLPDGRILAATGEAVGPGPIPVPDLLTRVKWTDIYDPVLNSWRRVADMLEFREYHALTMLIPDGRVITTGGTVIDFVVGPSTSDIEAFSPPYLFRGVRPEIANISTTEPTRGSSVVMDIAPATQLTSVVVIGAETVTHWVSGGITRRLELPFTQSGSEVIVTLPTDENLLPLGWYLIFAMVDDIPSVAKMISVGAEVSPGSFVRGDCNDDASVNLADAIRLLAVLFEGELIACDNACDTNDDGQLDVADAVFVLSYLFNSGMNPASPFPGCGNDATPGLTCVNFANCP